MELVVRETARRMKRFDTVIRNYLKLDHNYVKRMKIEENIKITRRNIGQIKEKAI